MERLSLSLYITGRTPRSEQAIANLHHLCDERLGDQYHLEIIDVLEQPELAEKNKIIATPTLIRISPAPPRRIIGDLSDLDQVASGLGLHFIHDHRSEESTGGR